MKMSKVIKCLMGTNVLRDIIFIFFFNQEEQILSSIPIAQPAPAATGTTILPTAVIHNVTDVKVVPIVIRPSVKLIRLFISWYLLFFFFHSCFPI